MSPLRRRIGIRGRTALVFAGCFLLLASALLVTVTVLTGVGLDASVRTTVSSPPASGSGPPVEASVSLSETVRGQQLLWSVVALTVATPLAGLVGWVTARRMLRPVAVVTSTAQRISAEHFDERIGLQGPDDELRRLADTFDELIGRLQGAFERQRRFIGDIAHELRTPLTVQRAAIQIGLDPDDPASTEAAVERLLAENRRMEALIDGLLALAVAENHGQVFVDVDLAELVHDAVGMVRRTAADRGVEVRLQAEPVAMSGDPALLSRLISNLLDNAVEYNVEDGWVEVTVRHGFLVVENTGSAVAAAEVSRLSEPFARGDDQRRHGGRHLGLGLSIVQAIADAHDAGLDLRPRVGGGLRVEFTVPDRAPSRSEP